MQYILPRGYLSYSQVAKYLRCGRQYWYDYMQEAPRYNNAEMALGSAVHAAIEMAHKRQALHVDFTLDDLYAEVHGNLIEQQTEAPWENAESPSVIQAMHIYGMACIDAWWEAFGRRCIPVEAEREVNKEIVPGVPFRAYIDLEYMDPDLTGAHAIADYKVTGRAKNQKWVDDNLQLMIYSALTGIERVGICFIQRPRGDVTKMPKGTPKASFLHLTTRVTEAQRTHAREIVRDVAAGITKEFFPRCLPGGWECSAKYCNHFAECRLRNA